MTKEINTDAELIGRLLTTRPTPAECLVSAARIEQLTAERDQWIAHTKNAVWADSEELKLAEAERDRLRALLGEADRRIAWEAHGFGNDFADKVEAALKGESHD